MLFRQLEYFVAVAQERHFARAAEKCYVSQPALSSAIAKLERELNVTLAGCDRAVPTAARIRARCRHRAPRDPRQ